MIQYTIKAPASLHASVKLPASKSISNRALIICALTDGQCMPENLSDCDDTEVTLRALRDRPETIDIKAAGTSMRFMTAYLAATVQPDHPSVLLTGTARMKQRPIKILVNALRLLGADIEYAGEEGFPPLRIRGKHLSGGRVEIAGNVSSQYISALLLIGPMLSNGLELNLTGEIISRPYIDLTLWTMREFGADVDWTSVDTITVRPKPYEPRPYYIENDWSAASYWHEMMALTTEREAEVRLEGLMDGSKQGDSSVRYLFSLLGIKSIFGTTEEGVPTTVTLRHTGHCVPRLEYDFVNSPDLAQTFIVCCAVMNIPFHFRGLSTLKIKETDRIEAMKTEMRKLGYVLHDVNGCELLWNGERCEPSLEAGIDTYEDHRMALSFAPAAFRIKGLTINHPEVVSKSYPKFWEDLKAVGFEF